MLTDPAPAPASAFLKGSMGRCPHCGKGKLFKGVLALQPHCQACNLDYSFADSGDGPAVIVIFLAGFIILALALSVEFAFSPPIWLHIMLWGPFSTGLCLVLLRLTKGVLIALQYSHKAAEGRIEKEP